jgi:cytochrome oxidase Cu insertion factor (SCO1/SenC/PrrC family)
MAEPGEQRGGRLQVHRLGPWFVNGVLAVLSVLTLTGCSDREGAFSGPASGSPYSGTELAGPAPDFRLVDQNGATVAPSDFRGKVVVLAFLDPECTDVCPLTANEFRLTAEKLEGDAERVVFLAVNVNPEKNSLEDVAGATHKWGVQNLRNWHYITGTRDELEPVYRAYSVLAEGPPKPDKPGELEHTPGAYVIDKSGQKRWYISTNFEGAPLLNELLVKHVGALLNE